MEIILTQKKKQNMKKVKYTILRNSASVSICQLPMLKDEVCRVALGKDMR